MSDFCRNSSEEGLAKNFATENEAMDGESLARREAQSPQGCEHDANNKKWKRLKRKDGRI